jgi:hypothetical protein
MWAEACPFVIETGNWKIEIGKHKLENRNWKIERRKSKVENGISTLGVIPSVARNLARVWDGSRHARPRGKRREEPEQDSSLRSE